MNSQIDKKNFEVPSLEVKQLDSDNIIATSSGYARGTIGSDLGNATGRDVTDFWGNW